MQGSGSLAVFVCSSWAAMEALVHWASMTEASAGVLAAATFRRSVAGATALRPQGSIRAVSANPTACACIDNVFSRNQTVTVKSEVLFGSMAVIGGL